MRRASSRAPTACWASTQHSASPRSTPRSPMPGSVACRAVLRALPGNVPWAIEYPLVGDDLPAATRREVAQLRRVAKTTA